MSVSLPYRWFQLHFWKMIESNHKVESTAKLVELEPLCIEEATKPTVTYDSSVGLVVSYAEEGNTEDRSYSLLDDDRRGWGKSINNFCFPPHLPQEVQLLRWENIAVPSCYLTVGILQGTFRPLLNVWPLDLGATEAQQTTMMIISTLPATFKILYGFWSDNVPMFGYRRKPYMALGWLLCSTMMAALISSLNGTIHDETVVKKSPSMQWLGAVFFFYGCGLWISDVMADSMVAQKTRSEPDNFRGHLQSTCYACRFFGQMMAAPVSSYLYSAHGPETVLRVLFIIPLLTIPLIVVMAEEQLVPPSTLAQCQEIWKTVCSRSVWQPMAFCYIFNLLQVPNVAWRQFLKTNLHFTAANLNALLVVSYAFLYLGTVVYKYFFLHTSWRRIYMVSMAVNFVLSALQLLLIQNRTGGLSPFWFALGDDAMAEFILGIQFLPTAILMVNLCPPGSEGASYAMFTTFFNSGQLLSPSLASRFLLGIWDVSKEALESGDLSGLFNLSILTTCIQLSPLLILGWLPRGREDLQALSQKAYSGHFLGGGLFLAVLFVSMACTFSIAMENILHGGTS